MKHSPTTRYLVLWTFRGRRESHGKLHLAKVKTTVQAATAAWCGRTLFPDTPPQYITGENAFFSYLAGAADDSPMCLQCLEAIGAWSWYEQQTTGPDK